MTATAPFELARMIQASSQTQASKQGLVSLMLSIISESGFAGLFRGYQSTVLRDVPYSAIYWLVFENSKAAFPETSLSVNSVNFLSGASGGIVAALRTHPFDVLKTRQQLCPQVSHNAQQTTKVCLSGAVSVASPSQHVVVPSITLRSLYHEGGVRSLYRGLQLRLATVVPGGAIMITVYEFVKRFGN